jgi:hypothetical protein
LKSFFGILSFCHAHPRPHRIRPLPCPPRGRFRFILARHSSPPRTTPMRREDASCRGGASVFFRDELESGGAPKRRATMQSGGCEARERAKPSDCSECWWTRPVRRSIGLISIHVIIPCRGGSPGRGGEGKKSLARGEYGGCRFVWVSLFLFIFWFLGLSGVVVSERGCADALMLSCDRTQTSPSARVTSSESGGLISPISRCHVRSRDEVRTRIGRDEEEPGRCPHEVQRLSTESQARSPRP